jgi:hypothetical protein
MVAGFSGKLGEGTDRLHTMQGRICPTTSLSAGNLKIPYFQLNYKCFNGVSKTAHVCRREIERWDTDIQQEIVVSANLTGYQQ